MLIFDEGGKPEYPEKNHRMRVRNQQSTIKKYIQRYIYREAPAVKATHTFVARKSPAENVVSLC
jgi:hypothetical protein